ncbi:MAG TPA: aldolase/citrate lyase family protein [Haliscomenobacter sp.]|uniref:aldolase/citrate lyase family protein n=1 Tax=Haliscomenobacter sp. TaxID=2717303 RepID=UPI001DF04B74|nr:aldolase/citrate lyase family protein [Haliscomenobacter sp.]MBK9490680.1 2-keto-3-deoxy-L-rhamnonate aldolase [Haliscomenobacter sp.]HOY17048.1 aldolase/citrate lyase family protein [Haliscomenobacter sp.]HPH18081.1 aldolase/citrate lyase family protein [Haliscomenobacter sp.]
MEVAKNKFKQAVQSATPQLGLWNGLVDNSVVEILAASGYDWVLVDGEHAPFDLQTILIQLQATARYDVPIFVRVPKSDPVYIKQILELGVQNILVPMVDSAEEAELMYKATQYPPKGIRGIGTAMARAAHWAQNEDYLHTAGPEICMVVQVENVEGIKNLDAILAVEGLEGVFIGPADLAASMGYLGEPNHPQVKATVLDALRRIRAAGKVAGSMALDKATADDYIAAGSNMVAIGIDTLLLAKGCRDLLRSFRADQDVASNKY